jgi:hypothetical protein
MKLKPEVWEEVALEQKSEARSHFLQVNCSDPQIQKGVFRLLANYEEMGSFLSEPGRSPSPAPYGTAQSGGLNTATLASDETAGAG